MAVVEKNLDHYLLLIYFIPPSLPDPNPSSGPEDEHIHLVGYPLAEAQEKATAPHTTARKVMFSTNCPSWRKHSPGAAGSMPDQSEEGMIYTLPCKLQQISLKARKVKHFSPHKLPGE